jgi:elongation factor P
MPISTNDMRPGMTLDLGGDLFNILEYQHHKPGKGQAMVRTKLRNLRTGAVIDKTFRADEKVELARVERMPMQVLYFEGNEFVVMDSQTFDQIHIQRAIVGDAAGFLKEGQTLQVASYQGSPISVELPTTVDLKVTQTDPGLQGDRSSAGTKPATLETGTTVQVPLFVTVGDVVRVDTRTGQYVTRVR